MIPEHTKENIIPLCCDKLFKKVFADDSHPERLENLLSICLNIPYEDLRGNVRLVNGELSIPYMNIKRKILDVLAEVKYSKGKIQKINIELNMDFYNTFKRNIAYGSKVFSESLGVGEDYDDIPDMIQINFDDFEINKKNPRIVKRYYIKDETNTILDTCLRYDHINIAKSKQAWYDKAIKKQEEDDQNLITFGALLMIYKKTDFLACLEEIKMDKKVKEEIKEAVLVFSSDPDSWAYLDEERDKIAKYNAGMSSARKKGYEEGEKEGIKQGIEQVAKNMLDENIPIETIIKTTGLTKENIQKLS